MIGRVLSHFRILEKVGAGGMGEVYVAEDTKLQRRVAIKVLPERVSKDAERLNRFAREARALATLNHAHIVTIYSLEEAEGIHFLAMELIEGHTLTSLIPPGGMIFEDIVKIAISLCDALETAHQAGIIHRDLKPDNVMIDKKGNLKVLDFGLAKFQKTGMNSDIEFLSTVTQPDLVIGTIPYMSPEQVQGRPGDSRIDIFALGIVLYRLATGKLPFQGNSPVETLSSILRDDPISVNQLRPDLPVLFSSIIQRCLEKDPDKRFQSTADVATQLVKLQEIYFSTASQERSRKLMI